MSLNQDIQAVVAQAREHAPPEAFQTLGAMFARLEREGVGAGAPKPGDKAPDATVLDRDGATVRLAALHAERPLALIFYRGRWCPFCDLTLRAYDRAAPEFAAAGASLAAVSPQTVLESATTGEERGLSYPLFSDPANRAARAFGLAWQVQAGAEQALYTGFGARVTEANGDDSWELPAPAVFVVDRTGVVRWSSVDANWTRRAEPEDVLAAVRAL
jgi:peroxiredoxin